MQIPRNRLIVYGVVYVGAMLIVGGLTALAVVRSRPAAVRLPTPPPTQATRLLLTVEPRTTDASPTPTVAFLAMATSTPVPTFTPEPTPACHRVQAGDNLTRLAKRYGVRIDDIKRANPQKWNWWNWWDSTIYPDECLWIPKK